MASEEYVDLVDDDDKLLGRALRSECHGRPELIHRAVHVLIFNSHGELILQKRSMVKDIQPGKWDTSVGGHLDTGESYRHAAVREMFEELGIDVLPLTRLYSSKIRNRIESENVETYMAVYNGPIVFAEDEIDEVRFWSADEIETALGTGCLTPNFEDEWLMFNQWLRKYHASPGERTLCAGDSFPDLFHALMKDDE